MYICIRFQTESANKDCLTKIYKSMKQYQNEQEFVANFAKDAKESIKSNGNFEAVWNNVAIVVTGMDNNNSSKVTMYSCTLDGVAFTGSITALKKRLNIQYTKEYNRTTEKAQSANTKVVIKSDDELQHTVDVSFDRLYNAVTSLLRIVNRYELSGILNEDDICSIRNEGVICRGDDVIPVMDLMMKKLKQERDEAKRKAEEREAAKREAEEERTKQRNALMAELAEASARQNFGRVMELSKLLAQLK